MTEEQKIAMAIGVEIERQAPSCPPLNLTLIARAAVAAMPSASLSPQDCFEQAIEEAERRGPNEALKELMASPSDPDSPTVRVVCPWCGRNMN